MSTSASVISDAGPLMALAKLNLLQKTAPVITRGNEIMIGGLRLVIRLRQRELA